MSHARQQIREAVAARLRTSSSQWGVVFETRLPTPRAVIPYLMVFADGESAAPATDGEPLVYQRRLNLVVSGRLRLPGNNDTQTVEDSMDALAAQVETTLTFAGVQASLAQLQALHLASTEMVVVTNEDAQPQHAEVTLAFVAEYYTQEGIPATLV